MIATLSVLLLKSALVAAAGLGLAALLRERSAAERARVLRATILILLALPFLSLWGPDLRLGVLQPAPPVAAQAAVVEASLPLPAARVSAVLTLPPLWTWGVLLWALVAAAILGRFFLGWLTLAHWSRQGRRVDQSDWLAALRRLAPARPPRLRASGAVTAPLSWGVSPGCILISPAQVSEPDQAEAVLAHELAHIRRADWLFLALSRLAVALFWINPLVWLTARELNRLSEKAVDEAVVRRVDREIYARTLIGLAARAPHSTNPIAAVGMTGPARTLAERIKSIMSDRTPSPARPWMIGAAIAALVVVATPLAAVELTARAAPATVSEAVTTAADTLALPVAAIVTEVATATVAQENRQISVTTDNRTVRYVSDDGEAYVIQADGSRRPLTAEERQEMEAALAQAEAARAQAGVARELAAQARAEAMVHREQALAHAAEARAQAHVAVQEAARARAEAAVHRDRAHAVAAEARAHAAREMAAARVEMSRGADEMERGARQMREEAQRLRDPAYRARQIEEQARRGHPVTDQELLDAIPRMLEGADRMEEGAARMREQSRSRD
ncbi:M56 family metallopeptidase [Brevundimonas sp. 2R-24]|uniref:M56 family metallopeptidase n=1 Tax=Peiella sedimenti TaxID=3061083 RepID=A0ABT8SJK9_9CAUL|nr:M56 family metallopeptidase [Caulobacteraceae bacterium XZ-24]